MDMLFHPWRRNIKNHMSEEIKDLSRRVSQERGRPISFNFLKDQFVSVDKIVTENELQRLEEADLLFEKDRRLFLAWFGAAEDLKSKLISLGISLEQSEKRSDNWIASIARMSDPVMVETTETGISIVVSERFYVFLKKFVGNKYCD
mgnify:CR=1 FL=1